jgi:2-succinyl-5-enolpyruvyl-6-hydroxy-3-cyclohexene-1-carboxylate synthase
VIAHADGIVGSPTALAALAPDIVVRLGSPHASKRLGGWCDQLADAGVPQLLIDPDGAFEDPARSASLVFRADPAALFAAASADLDGKDPADPRWLATWRAADDAAETAIADLVANETTPTEPGIARAVVDAVPDGSIVFVSSSMPVRDVEWFAPARRGAPRVLSNRGANGIDGVTSTVLGVAAAIGDRSTRVVGLLGDLALLYDLSGLVFGTREVVPDATLVVIDNRGGGIFSFLPYPDVLNADDFERAFGTPQRPDIAATVRGLGHAVVECATTAEVAAAVRAGGPGITVVLVRTDRAANVALHALAERTVAAAVAAATAGA